MDKLSKSAELLILRHAPLAESGVMAGRRDAAAQPVDSAQALRIRAAAGEAARLWVSPARRCRTTATAIFPDLAAQEDFRLWEQDFGLWEGRAYDALPDLGRLSAAELAAHRAPSGESFADLCARLAPALREAAALGGRSVICAHAGIARGALAWALGSAAAGMAFEIAPLSLTLIRLAPGGAGASIAYVNRVIP